MQERIYRQLCAAAQSLGASSELAVTYPNYSIIYRRRNSLAVSCRELEFGPAMIASRGGFFMEEVALLQNRRAVLLLAAEPIQPAESVWQPPAHLCWEGGLVPTEMVRYLTNRTRELLGVEPLWLYAQSLVAAYTLSPVLSGWDEGGRPIFLQPEEGWEGVPSMLDGQAFRPPWADPPIPTRGTVELLT